MYIIRTIIIFLIIIFYSIQLFMSFFIEMIVVDLRLVKDSRKEEDLLLLPFEYQTKSQEVFFFLSCQYHKLVFLV